MVQATMSALRKFADVLRSFVHCLQQTAESFGEGDITNAATQPPGLLEISLGEGAARAFDFSAAGGLFDLLRSTEAEE